MPIIQPRDAPHTVPSPPHPQSQPRQTCSMQSLQWDLNQVRQSQHTPQSIWQWRQAEGTVAPPMSTMVTESSGTEQAAAGRSNRTARNFSKVQICSERSLPSLQPKRKQIPNLCHPWRGRLSISCAHTEVSAGNCHHFRACKGRKGRGEEIGHISWHLQGHTLTEYFLKDVLFL